MPRNNEKGLSLLELIAALVLVSIVIGVISALIMQSTNGFNRITAKQSLQEQARQVSEQLVTIIRYTPWQPDRATQGNQQQLLLQYLKNETTTEYGTFSFADRTLTFTRMENELETENRILADNIIDLAIELNNSITPPSIHFRFTLEADNGDTYDFETKLYLQMYNQ